MPQGSVLGPVLFNIFINDLDDEATVRQILKKFADDTKVGQIIEGQNDSAELQATLDRLCQWAARWGMAFNVQKCHVRHVGRINPCTGYTMNGEKLEATDNERDIGVIITNNLNQPSSVERRPRRPARYWPKSTVHSISGTGTRT
jgi:hypothetical protein